MNNWLIIVLPVLSLGGFAYGVWQRQMARHDAERAFEKKQTLLQEAYRELQVDHGVDLARADGLAQDVERLTSERDDARAQRDRIQQELYVADAELERLVNENDKLHVREKLLIETVNKQPIEEKGNVDEAPVETTRTQDNAKPRRTHKRQATDTASN